MALASGAADSIGIVASLLLFVVVVAGAADSVVVVSLLPEAAVVFSFLAHAEASAMALATRMIRATGLILAISNMF